MMGNDQISQFLTCDIIYITNSFYNINCKKKK